MASTLIRTKQSTLIKVGNVLLGSKLNYPYKTVIIDEQLWFAENYRETKTKMGFVIPEIQDNSIWASSKTLYNNAISGGATVREALKEAAMITYYNNDKAGLGETYGVLYNWYAAMLIQIDIDAYNAVHVSNPYIYKLPTSQDFTDLITYLGGNSVAGGKLKETGLVHWISPNTGATNESGFTALGSGYRIGTTGAFDRLKTEIRLWSQSEIDADKANIIWCAYDVNNSSVLQHSKEYGYSIRLISTQTFPVPLT